MIPVFQTKQHPPCGDCQRAAVASLFELPIEAVPDFVNDSFPMNTESYEDWQEMTRTWAAQRGFAYVPVDATEYLITCVRLSNAIVLAAGKSPRGDWLHAVLMQGGKLIHDPHPSGAGLDGPPTSFDLFIPLDPARVLIEATTTDSTMRASDERRL